MALYPQTKLTDAGVNLQSRSITEKKPIIFTSINIGSGDLSGTNISNMTGLKQERMSLPIIDVKKATASGQYTITAALSNREVNQEFWGKEVGVFAKLEGDKTPILYTYANAGEKGLYIPSKENPIESQIYRVDVRVSQSASVTIVIDDTVYLTKKELVAHNADPESHDGLIRKVKEAIDNHRTKSELDHPNLSVKAKHLASSAVTHEKLAADAIYGSCIKKGAITTEKLADASVGREQLKDGSVYGLAIKDNGVENKHLATNSVSQRNIQGSCIDSSNVKPKGIKPESLDREYLSIIKEAGRVRAYGYSGYLYIPSTVDLGGSILRAIATANGDDPKQAVNWGCMQNNTVASFDGLHGNIDFYNYISRYKGMNIDKLSPKEIAKKGFFWNYYQNGDSGVKGLPYASAVLHIRDDIDGGGRNDSWEIAFCHNGGRENENLKIRHVTDAYSKCEDVAWVTLATTKMLEDLSVIEKRVYD